MLWLVALAPTFPLAFHKGWRGAAISVGIGGAVLTVTLLVATFLGQGVPAFLGWVVIAFLAIAAGIGRVAHLMHRQRDDVQDLALTDNLTRLPNRRHARAFLENEFAAANRGHLLAVTLFDLDGFKSFNDLHGHRAGDRALKRFGEILASTTRRMNLSSRFGGEEFLSILSGSDEEGGVAFAERVREALESVQLAQGSLTVSAGVAAYHPSMRSPDELIAAADLALYRAKGDGRNCVRIFGQAEDSSEETHPPAQSSGAGSGEVDRGDVGEAPEEKPAESDGGEDAARVAGVEAALSVVRAVEIRDTQKAGHASRVGLYANTIARAAGMIPSLIDADSLQLACQLHDVGEIGVPREILKKVEPLTHEELIQVQQHPVIGARMVELLLSDEHVIAVARWHHERWDGSGYPDALIGEAIPPAARVVAIADALEAMTSPRAYRTAYPWPSAVGQILGLGGSHFDPDLIDRFRMAQPELERLADASQGEGG